MSRKTTNLTTMKRFFLMALMIFTITSIYSQTEKGKMLLGGQFNFSGSNRNTGNGTYKSHGEGYGFTLAPNYGYFISDNFEIGAKLSISAGNNWSDSNDDIYKHHAESHSTGFGIGAFSRRYFTISEKFRFYLNGDLSYASSTYKNSNSDNSSNSDGSQDQTSLKISVAPGLVYFVTPKLGFEAQFGSLGYSVNSNDFENNYTDGTSYNYSTDSNGFGINLNTTSFYLGLNYYF